MDELQVEERIVTHEHGPIALLRLDFLAHHVEHPAECLVFVHGQAKRMERVDTGHFQGGRLEARAGERLYVIPDGLGGVQFSVLVEPQQDCGDLEQRVGGGIETSRLHVHGYRQETAKAAGDARRRAWRLGGWLIRRAHNRSAESAPISTVRSTPRE